MGVYMIESCFNFIKSFEPEIYQKIIEMEERIRKKDHAQAIIIGRSVSEDITDRIGFYENINVKGLGQYDTIHKLNDFNVLDYKIEKPLNTIRRTCNDIAHYKIEANLESCLKIHRNLYESICWLYENYAEDDFYVKVKYPSFDPTPSVVPVHSDPTTTEEKLEPIIKEDTMESNSNSDNESNDVDFDELSDMLDDIYGDDDEETVEEIHENDKSQTTLPLDNSDLINPNMEFSKLNGSFLLNELSKLKDSSHEAVEGYESLSKFKKYLHVKREIENEFLEKLKEVKDKPSSQLVMLCGSVGDGKSHLIAYLNSEHPEVMSKFKIHNDATESFDPDKTAIDTLAKVLTAFDDNHIDYSNEKRILAINLGVLNNFMESDYAKEQYTKLNSLLKETNIFDTEETSQNYDKEPIHIISFSDYNLYELNEEGVDSEYLKKLFSKVTDISYENPFYQAYLRDVTNNYHGPIRYNYELLMNENARYEITQLVIKAIVKFKRIVSTRELLNFIYEIIVPPVINEYDDTYEVLDYITEILPNLIYTTSQRSPLLKIIAMHDPINLRRELLDEFLINLNMTNDLGSVIHEYLVDCKETSSFIKSIGKNYIYAFKPFEEDVINTIIRYSSILGKENIKYMYTRDSYREFIQYLYVYNTHNKGGFKELFERVRGAVFRWKGSPMKNFILIDELKNFNIAEKIDLSLVLTKKDDSDTELGNRFKTDIVLNFKVNDHEEPVSLNIDYTLYTMITKLNKGYKPNKNDKEDLVVFREFIDELIKKGSSDKQLLIEDINTNRKFNLEYDATFEEFSFEQGEF